MGLLTKGEHRGLNGAARSASSQRYGEQRACEAKAQAPIKRAACARGLAPGRFLSMWGQSGPSVMAVMCWGKELGPTLAAGQQPGPAGGHRPVQRWTDPGGTRLPTPQGGPRGVRGATRLTKPALLRQRGEEEKLKAYGPIEKHCGQGQPYGRIPTPCPTRMGPNWAPRPQTRKKDPWCAGGSRAATGAYLPHSRYRWHCLGMEQRAARAAAHQSVEQGAPPQARGQRQQRRRGRSVGDEAVNSHPKPRHAPRCRPAAAF